MELPPINLEETEKKITSFIRKIFNEAGREKAYLGVSGGVDSATTLFLAAKALGAENVKALIMPSFATPKEDLDDAKEVCKKAGVEYEIINIDPILDAYEKVMGKLEKVTKGNTMARIRMTILYAKAHKDGLVVGTGDKSELLLGYFTKWGDGAVDLLPIGDLYKTYVRKLALYLGVPERVALKKSSPRLWVGQLAEDELGISYERADAILYYLVDEGRKPEEIIRLGIPSEDVKKVLELMNRNSHKLKPIPIAKVLKVTAHEFFSET